MVYKSHVTVRGDIALAALDSFFANRGFTREQAESLPETTRANLARRWLVSSERAKMEYDLACSYDLPCAADGLTSYRYRGSSAWVMIGARDNEEALQEAARSITGKPDINLLQIWNGSEYVDVN